MTVTTRAPHQPEVADVPAWAGVLVALAVVVMYLVAFEAGPVSTALGQGAALLHEAFHDGRHALGVPCH